MALSIFLIGIDRVIGRYILGNIFSVRQLLAAFNPDLVSQRLYAQMSMLAFAYLVLVLNMFFIDACKQYRTPTATSGLNGN